MAGDVQIPEEVHQSFAYFIGGQYERTRTSNGTKNL